MNYSYSPYLKFNMEAYRSGHNGPDSKSGSPHGLVGSNPTASAMVGASFISFAPTFFTKVTGMLIPQRLLFRKRLHHAFVAV